MNSDVSLLKDKIPAGRAEGTATQSEGKNLVLLQQPLILFARIKTSSQIKVGIFFFIPQSNFRFL